MESEQAQTRGDQIFTLYCLIEKIDKEAIFIADEIKTINVPEENKLSVTKAMDNIRGIVFDIRDNVVVAAANEGVTIMDILAYPPTFKGPANDRLAFIQKKITEAAKQLRDTVTFSEAREKDDDAYRQLLILLHGCGGDILFYASQSKDIINNLTR